MIYIDGWYENGDDGYYYEIYLRPWGLRWDDAGEDYLPYLYDDWYLPLIDAGKSMPDSIGMDDSAEALIQMLQSRHRAQTYPGRRHRNRRTGADGLCLDGQGQ